MGCVTWLERYFADRNLGQEILMLQKKRHAKCYVRLPMNTVSRLESVRWRFRHRAGVTGIMMAQGMDERITLEKLQQLNSEPFIAVGWRNWRLTG